MWTRPTHFQGIDHGYPNFIADLLGYGREHYAGSLSWGSQSWGRDCKSLISPVTGLDHEVG
jgi:hypothetical protein